MPAEPTRTDKFDFSPLPNPHAFREPRKDRTATTHWAVGVIGAVLSAAYAVSCLYRAYEINVDRGYLNKLIAAPNSVSLDEMTQVAHSEHVAGDVNLVLFWAMFVTVMIWVTVLGKKVDQLGHRGLLRRLAAWQVWRVGIWVALALSFIVRAPQPGASLESFVSFDEKVMIFLAVRAVIGAVYVWVALSVAKAVAPILRGDVRPQPDVYDLANAAD